MAVTIGQTLGAYRLEALIGKGAFGLVIVAPGGFHSGRRADYVNMG